MRGVMLGHHPDICSSVTYNAYPHSTVWHNWNSQHLPSQSCTCMNSWFLFYIYLISPNVNGTILGCNTVHTACAARLLESTDMEFVYCLKQPAVWYSPCSSSPLLSCPVSWDAGYCPAAWWNKSRSVRPVKGSLSFSLTAAAQPCAATHKASALTACRHGNHWNSASKL